MPRLVRTASQLSAFRRLVRDVRNPARLRENPLACSISCAEPDLLAESVERALAVSLYRLPSRLREIVARYDLQGEPMESVCLAIGLSRRQFFRDHRAALLQLASLMLDPTGEALDAAACTVDVRGSAPGAKTTAFGSVTRSLAAGFVHLGSYDEALRLFARDGDGLGGRIDRQIESALDAAEIAVEAGRTDDAKSELEWVRLACRAPGNLLPLRLAAQRALVEGHLEPSHRGRQERYRQAIAILERSVAAQPQDDACGRILVRTLYALSLSHDHQGEWVAAREAARQAIAVLCKLGLTNSPIGLFVRANHSMRDARQFGNVDLPLEALWECLDLALRNGWMPVVGDIAVQFFNLNLMRLQYGQALRWRQWLSGVDASRLTARTRNFLAVDCAHGLTMLGRPDRALVFLQGDAEEGLAFAGVREYWRAEALRVAGNVPAALRLASRALERAIEADCQKGQARCKRLLASCHYALGHLRLARKTMSECLELSERYVSPYDLLLSVMTARGLDQRYQHDEERLSYLLRGRRDPSEFDPPSADSA